MASKLLQLQEHVQEQLPGEGKTAEEIARSIDADPEDVFHFLPDLASNTLQMELLAGEEAVDDRFCVGESA